MDCSLKEWSVMQHLKIKTTIKNSDEVIVDGKNFFIKNFQKKIKKG